MGGQKFHASPRHGTVEATSQQNKAVGGWKHKIGSPSRLTQAKNETLSEK
jgi:hypothetical protein